MYEKDLEMKLIRELKRLDVLALKFVSPGNRGVPDRLIIGHFGNIYFVELKRNKDYKVTKLQRYWNRVLSSRFVKNLIIHNDEELKIFIEDLKKDERYLKPVNRIGFIKEEQNGRKDF